MCMLLCVIVCVCECTRVCIPVYATRVELIGSVLAFTN